jgi:hypothetical protein
MFVWEIIIAQFDRPPMTRFFCLLLTECGSANFATTEWIGQLTFEHDV